MLQNIYGDCFIMPDIYSLPISELCGRILVEFELLTPGWYQMAVKSHLLFGHRFCEKPRVSDNDSRVYNIIRIECPNSIVFLNGTLKILSSNALLCQFLAERLNIVPQTKSSTNGSTNISPALTDSGKKI